MKKINLEDAIDKYESIRKWISPILNVSKKLFDWKTVRNDGEYTADHIYIDNVKSIVDSNKFLRIYIHTEKTRKAIPVKQALSYIKTEYSKYLKLIKLIRNSNTEPGETEVSFIFEDLMEKDSRLTKNRIVIITVGITSEPTGRYRSFQDASTFSLDFYFDISEDNNE